MKIPETPDSPRQLSAAIALCVACSVLFCALLLRADDWYITNQGYRYPYLLTMFREQFLAGQYYPRWLPGLDGGYGYPTFMFYAPGFWFLSLPLSLLLESPTLVCKIMLVVIMAFGGLGAWKLARCFCSARSAALVTAAYYLSPQIAYSLYFRGSISELMASQLIPWLFFTLWRIRQQIAHSGNALPSAMGFSITLAALVYTHPIITIWADVTLLICVPFAFLGLGKRPWVLGMAFLAASACLSLALSASYWYPALAWKSYVQYEKGLIDSMTFQSLALADIFAFGASRLGLVQPLLALLGLCLARKSWFMRSLLAVYVLYTLYMPPLSLPLRHAIPAIAFLQWPSRVITIMMTLHVIGTALLFAYLEPRLKPLPAAALGILLLAVLTIAASPHYALRGTMYFQDFVEERTRMLDDMTHAAEFTPRTAYIGGLASRQYPNRIPIALPLPSFPVTETTNNHDIDIRLRVSPAKTGLLLINQFYFPGWKITLNGAELPMCPEAPLASGSVCHATNGRIGITLPPGMNQELHIWYSGEPDAFIRNSLSLAATLLAILALRALARSTANPAGRNPKASGTRQTRSPTPAA